MENNNNERKAAEIVTASQLIDKLKMLQREQEILAYEQASKHFDEFASLKHTLGRPRANILSWADNLYVFFNDNPKGFKSLNQSFKEFYEVDILHVLKEIKDDVSFMTKILEKGEDSFRIEAYNNTFISLSEIEDLINNVSSSGFNFKIKKVLLIDKTNKEKLKSRGIKANKELFMILIDSILTNAHRHAFDDSSKANKVVFELKEANDFLLLQISNNGKPFPRNYNKKKFIAKYSTADFKRGVGMGGYDIDRIATKFGNPQWELLLNDNPTYPVIYKFKFLIKVID